MIRDWLSSSPAGIRVLPQRVDRPMPWIVAIMVFVMVIVAASGLAIANAARLVSAGVDNRYSIQIPDGARWLEPVAAAARGAPGVLSVQPVPEAEVRSTLQDWLGPEAARADLPLPGLIDLEIGDQANVAAVAQRVEAAAPGARLVSYSDQLQPLEKSLRALQWLASGLLMLMAIATGAAVTLATRGAFDSHRSTIEVLHGLGATDRQLAALFQKRLASEALLGGVAGAAAAGLILLLILAAPGGLTAELAGRPALGWSDAALLASLPLLGAVLATLVARATILKALRATL